MSYTCDFNIDLASPNSVKEMVAYRDSLTDAFAAKGVKIGSDRYEEHMALIRTLNVAIASVETVLQNAEDARLSEPHVKTKHKELNTSIKKSNKFSFRRGFRCGALVATAVIAFVAISIHNKNNG